MAKANKQGVSFTPEELSDEDSPVKRIRIQRAELGRVDQPCPTEADGTDSSASSEKTQQTEQQGPHNPQSPVNADDPSNQTGPDSGVPTTGDDGQTTDQESPDDDEVPPYIEWTLEELKEECRSRDLPVSGNKGELAARLEAYDAEHADD